MVVLVFLAGCDGYLMIKGELEVSEPAEYGHDGEPGEPFDLGKIRVEPVSK